MYLNVSLFPGFFTFKYTEYDIMQPQEREDNEPKAVNIAEKLHINIFFKSIKCSLQIIPKVNNISLVHKLTIIFVEKF